MKKDIKKEIENTVNEKVNFLNKIRKDLKIEIVE